VLLTPHIEHYTIGLSKELSKIVNLTLLTDKFVDTKARQLIIPRIMSMRLKVPRTLLYRGLSPLFDVIHVNTSIEGACTKSFDKVIIIEHGWPDPNFVEEDMRSYYRMERESLLYLHKMGIPIVTISNYCAEMLRTIGVKVYSVIYHGLNRSFISNKPRIFPTKHRILWASRLINFKEPFVFWKH
jgi:hypothetical protein